MAFETLDLKIDRLVHGGRGLGHSSDKAVFVPLTAPGDYIRCRVVREKKSFIEAELVEVLEPSPMRREPPCPLFGSCGGCQWQQLPYADQVNWKERIFTEQLTRSGIADQDSLRPLVPSPTEFRYRNRVQFKCRMTHDGFVIGFFRTGSHFVIDVAHCLLVQPSIQEVLSLLRRKIAGAPAPDCIPQIDVTCSDDGCAQIIVHVLPPAAGAMATWLGEFGRDHALGVSMQIGRKDTLRQIHGETAQILLLDSFGLTLQVGPGGFSQINPRQNRALIAEVSRLADLRGSERILDLFCGVGNFSLPLAREAATLDGVEAYTPAISDARRNAEFNGIDNTRFHADDATQALDRLYQEGCYDLVVLDPPRTGCYAVARALQNHRPERIIYVSCDPATLVRDLMPLVNDGYQVVSSQPFDLFPQTWHIESITHLQATGRF